MTVVAGPRADTAVLWRLLSLGFAPPSEETVAETELLAGVLAELDDPPPELPDVLDAIRSATVERIAADYETLFGVLARVPPYEGSYEVDPIRQGRRLADLAGFYRAFGAEAHGPAAERPDHVGCELEFLAFLELRHLAAVAERDDASAALVHEIGTAFLRDHAGRWLPAFLAAVAAASTPSPFYRALAALGARALARELESREIECEPLPRRSAPRTVERDSFDCG